MSYQHHYKARDFDFSQQLVSLRKKAGLTQKEVALHVGLAEKSIRNWEGGSNYPTSINLRRLIELYLDHHAFAPEHEQDEARQLWEQLHERSPMRIKQFDERWFAAVLQAQSVNQKHLSTAHRSLLIPLPVEPEHQDFPTPRPSTRLLSGDWSEALDVSCWYGRTDELAQLERWLLTEQCRLVTVLGMGGIGKTALAVKLVQRVAARFDCLLWHSLHNATPLEEVLRDWLAILAEQRDLPLPQGVEQGLALLIGLLQERRCLLVLDNLETVFQVGTLEGHFREGYEGYATLIRHVAQTTHQSCLVVTSRELPPEVGIFTGPRDPVRVFRLGSLALAACQQLLQDKGLFGEQAAWGELVQRYAGNPLALKVVAETVRELFGGDIVAFLAHGLVTFSGIRQLLAQQFERLSALEQTLLYWLAIERELIPLETFEEDLWPARAVGEVLEALHSLRSRSLVERGERGAVFTLQPVILEYVTERLVSQMSEEIRESRPVLLLSHALLQAQAKDYLRNSQARLLLQAVLDRLLAHFGTPSELEAHLERLLQQLRALPRLVQGYGAGNVVNLLVRFNGHVKGKDCSHLTVWQANLQEAEAQDVSFAGSDLAGSVFMEVSDSILTMTLSADGQYVAASGMSGKIRLWRTTDGQSLLTLSGHVGLVSTLAFHPQGRLLASGGYDGLVKVWEISRGQCVSNLQGHTKWVGSVVFHPAGRLIATSSDDGSIRLWDLAAGHCLKVWYEQPSEIWSLALSPAGRLLACGDADGVVKLWDLSSEQCLWSSAAHPGSPVRSLAFSPDDNLLVSAGQDGTFMVWETSSGEQLNIFTGHTDVVYSVAFNAEGLLSSGSRDRSVKLWRIRPRGEATCLSTLQGHSERVRSTVCGPGGLLVSGSQDGVVKLWQIIREGEGGKCLRTLRGYALQVNSVTLSPDGGILVSSEQNGMVRMWETRSGQCLHILSRQVSDAFAAAFHPAGRLVATSSPASEIYLWDVGSGRRLRTLQGYEGEIWALAFSPDGRFLLSGGDDHAVKLWEVSSGQCLRTLRGHQDWVGSVAYSPDGQLLASGDLDGVVKLWELNSGQCLKTWHGDPKAILALTFAPDSATLLSSNEQGMVTIWETRGGACLKTMPGIGDAYWQQSVALSPDGSLLAAVGSEQTVKVWDVSKGELLQTLPSHAGRPWSVSFSADQRLLASGTDEGSILLWERQTGRCLITLRSEQPYERMSISGVTGITEAQRASLKALGAIEEEEEWKF